ncbi:MAG: DUF2905 domain-containing protein [Sedimentisphaeraceae bacterium JB056]
MSEFSQIGKVLIITGIFLIVIGIVIVIGGKFNLFNLPGDISFGGKNWKVFFPIGTSIVISIVLTLIFWIISKFLR